MYSFWEKDVWVNYNLIGSGIVGLSTAISFCEKNPKSRVLVLEKGLLPTGASTKNAGFACFGSLTELLADIKRMSVGQMQALVEKRWQGLQKLRNGLGNDALEFRNWGGYELLPSIDNDLDDKITQLNQWLYPIFNQNVFSRLDENIASFGFNQKLVKSLVFNHLEGQIHTGKMMQALLTHAQKQGVRVMTGATVSHFEKESNQIRVFTGKNHFNTQKLAICTNAFTQDLLPKYDIAPGRGQVLITKPIPQLPFRRTFHFDEGYYYFRNYKNQVILGGGRNLDPVGETTTTLDTTPLLIENLKEKLKTLILPHQSFEISHTWAGIMAFGENTKEVIVEKISPHIAIGVRLNGMGVAIGSLVGEQVPDLLLNNE